MTQESHNDQEKPSWYNSNITTEAEIPEDARKLLIEYSHVSKDHLVQHILDVVSSSCSMAHTSFYAKGYLNLKIRASQ